MWMDLEESLERQRGSGKAAPPALRPGGTRCGDSAGAGFLATVSHLGSDGDGNDNAILMRRDEGTQPKYISRGALPGMFYGTGEAGAGEIPPHEIPA